MSSVLVIATVGCVVANAFIAIADYARAPFVLANSAEVRLPQLQCRTWRPSNSRALSAFSWDFSGSTGWAWRQESA